MHQRIAMFVLAVLFTITMAACGGTEEDLSPVDLEDGEVSATTEALMTTTGSFNTTQGSIKDWCKPPCKWIRVKGEQCDTYYCYCPKKVQLQQL
jgi:hypothetical protein